jgi:F0F1-type ATP synthase assembly protein I
MRAFNIIFGWFFLLWGCAAGVGALMGNRSQILITVCCVAMAWVLRQENKKDER